VSGQELGQESLVVDRRNPGEQARINRRAAVHVADRIAAENPHPLEDTMPRLAGRLVGQDPAVAAGLLELLAALGLPTTRSQQHAGREAS
jgi:hypothetical protein